MTDHRILTDVCFCDIKPRTKTNLSGQTKEVIESLPKVVEKNWNPPLPWQPIEKEEDSDHLQGEGKELQNHLKNFLFGLD